MTAVAGRSVVTDMDGGGALCVAEAGRRMRVLAETEDGWLHVFLPRDDLDGSLNQPGIYGYLRREDVALWLGPDAYFPELPPCARAIMDAPNVERKRLSWSGQALCWRAAACAASIPPGCWMN